MHLVDAQVHVGVHKYQPLESYLPQLSAAGVDGAVLVQYAGTVDNTYLAQCLIEHPGPFAGVAAIDHNGFAGPSEVKRIAEAGVFSSVRIPAGARSPEGDGLDVWRAIADGGLVATVQGPFDEVVGTGFATVMAELPDLPVVLEHLGCFRYELDDGFDSFLGLADYPNVSTMWSCFYRFSRRPYPHRDAWPYLALALERFGPERILWSGDINRADQGLGDRDDDYERAVALIQGRIAELTRDERASILGLTAARLYGCDLP